MKTVKVYINSSLHDSEELFGVFFAESSVTALMTPPPVKEYIQNKSALSHGKQVLTGGGALPKADDRDIQLTFGLRARTLTQFITRYKTFCAELEKGALAMTVEIREGDTFLKETYHLIYLSCAQYSEFNGRLAKFVLKLNEPNPKNRSIEHSADISL